MMRYGMVLFAFAGAACVVEPSLLPEQGAERDAVARNAATMEAAGVRVFVDGDAWHGQLNDVVTPVRATIENNSGRPLRVASADFVLAGKKQYRARVLQTDDKAVSMGRSAPALTFVVARVPVGFESSGFFVSPAYERSYPRHEPWPRNLRGPEPSVLSGASDDMLAAGIPEGVLESGGYVSGFIFFERVEPKEVRVVFDYTLADPDTGQPFGAVKIPLAVRW